MIRPLILFFLILGIFITKSSFCQGLPPSLLSGIHITEKSNNILFEQYIIKVQEIEKKAIDTAKNRDNQQLTPAHFLKGMLEVEENVGLSVLKKITGNVSTLSSQTDNL